MNEIFLDDYLQVEERIRSSSKPTMQLAIQYGLTQETVKEIILNKPNRQIEMPLPLDMPQDIGIVRYDK